MSDENKLNKPKIDISDTEDIEERLEKNWERITEENERKAANKALRSIVAMLVCFLLLIIIDALNINSDIDFILSSIIVMAFIFHFFRIMFLSPDSVEWTRRWF